MITEWTLEEAELVMCKFDEYGIEEDSAGHGPHKRDPEYSRLIADFLLAQEAVSQYAHNQIVRHGLDPEGCW
jgi:hypothetical protein